MRFEVHLKPDLKAQRGNTKGSWNNALSWKEISGVLRVGGRVRAVVPESMIHHNYYNILSYTMIYYTVHDIP